jgi:glycosyltransferase involved in cell wall biosynthesis
MRPNQSGGVIFVGILPPPVTGANVINAACIAFLRKRGIAVKHLDTSPGSLRKDLTYHFRRITRVFRCFTQIAAMPAAEPWVLYISLAAGAGQLYDIAIISLARIKRIPMVAHHHSFRNLNAPSPLHRLVQLALRGSAQVALCKDMERKIRQLYNEAAKVTVVSNSAFYAIQPAAYPTKRELKNVGFIGYLTYAKGFDRFLQLVAQLRKNGYSVQGHVAGEGERSKWNKFDGSEEIVKHWGYVSGDAKRAFFECIDVLIIPSRDEAEPLVIIEALASGTPVIATDVGCIPQMLAGGGGFCVPSSSDTIIGMFRHLRALIEKPKILHSLSNEAVEAYRATQLHAEADKKTFVELFSTNLSGVNADP